MPRTNKPKTNAERQAAYRRRHLDNPYGDDDDRRRRINLIVSVSARYELDRLAACYGVTRRAVLERLLEEAEISAVEALPGSAQRAYYDMQPTPLRGHAIIPARRHPELDESWL